MSSALTWRRISPFALGTSRPGVTAVAYSPDGGTSWICEVDQRDGPDERTSHASMMDAVSHAQERLDALLPSRVQT